VGAPRVTSRGNVQRDVSLQTRDTYAHASPTTAVAITTPTHEHRRSAAVAAPDSSLSTTFSFSSSCCSGVPAGVGLPAATASPHAASDDTDPPGSLPHTSSAPEAKRISRDLGTCEGDSQLTRRQGLTHRPMCPACSRSASSRRTAEGMQSPEVWVRTTGEKGSKRLVVLLDLESVRRGECHHLVHQDRARRARRLLAHP
jgi:hypothetical protein